MANKEQSAENHAQYVPLFHFITLGSLLIVLIGAIVYLLTGDNASQLFPWLFLTLVLIVFSIAFFARAFALKAQDRAIRAEENFRFYLLTGNKLSPELHIHQIIALRFAPDEEFVDLADQAVREKLSPAQIKKLISIWKADHYRV
jgi:hypothetical protein